MKDWPATGAIDPWEEPADRPARRRLGWVALGLLSLLIFELTADPALAVAVGCLKFGGDGLATARWLRRADPDRRRGRVVARFYTASAFWNVAGIATALGIIASWAFRQIEALRPIPARAGPPPQVLGAFLVALIAFTLAGLLSLFAVASAWRARVRVWLGPQARRARRLGIWPPSLADAAAPPFNGAVLIVLVAILSVAIPLGFFSMLGIVAAIAAATGPRVPLLPAISAGVILPIVIVFLLGRAVVAARMALVGRIAAASPWECWPIEGPSGVPTREDSP